MRLELFVRIILLFFLGTVCFPEVLAAAGQTQAAPPTKRSLGKKRVRIMAVRDAGGEIAGMEYFIRQRRYVKMGDTEFPVADVGHTLVSADRNVILKYGDPAAGHDEFDTDLYWYDGGGRPVNKIVGAYQYLRVAMSPDGFVAVCGRTIGGKKDAIVLFKPNGDVLNPAIPFPVAKGCFRIAVATGGFVVGVLTVNRSGDWDKTADLEVYSRRGTRRVLGKGINYPQGIFLSGEGAYALVPGKNKLVLADLKRGRVLWTKRGFFRLANRYGFRADTKRRIAIVNTVTIDREKSPDGMLTLNLLSLPDGFELLKKHVPEVEIQDYPRALFDSEGNLLMRTDRKEFRIKTKGEWK